ADRRRGAPALPLGAAGDPRRPRDLRPHRPLPRPRHHGGADLALARLDRTPARRAAGRIALKKLGTAAACRRPRPALPNPRQRGGALLPLAVCGAFHSGIVFSSSLDLPILKAPLSASHLKSSSGSATRWPPTPATPPVLTTRRSMVLLSGFISAV